MPGIWLWFFAFGQHKKRWYNHSLFVDARDASISKLDDKRQASCQHVSNTHSVRLFDEFCFSKPNADITSRV